MIIYRVYQSECDCPDSIIGYFTEKAIAAEAAETFECDVEEIELDRHAMAIRLGMRRFACLVSKALKVVSATVERYLWDAEPRLGLSGNLYFSIWVHDAADAEGLAISVAKHWKERNDWPDPTPVDLRMQEMCDLLGRRAKPHA